MAERITEAQLRSASRRAAVEQQRLRRQKKYAHKFTALTLPEALLHIVEKCRVAAMHTPTVFRGL
jgi:hypothetical protein